MHLARQASQHHLSMTRCVRASHVGHCVDSACILASCYVVATFTVDSKGSNASLHLQHHGKQCGRGLHSAQRVTHREMLIKAALVAACRRVHASTSCNPSLSASATCQTCTAASSWLPRVSAGRHLAVHSCSHSLALEPSASPAHSAGCCARPCKLSSRLSRLDTAHELGRVPTPSSASCVPAGG